MRITITPERAIADGISPNELRSVAAWHDERAQLVQRSLDGGGKKKRRQTGDMSDVRRHQMLAVELREIAVEVMYVSAKAAA